MAGWFHGILWLVGWVAPNSGRLGVCCVVNCARSAYTDCHEIWSYIHWFSLFWLVRHTYLILALICPTSCRINGVVSHLQIGVAPHTLRSHLQTNCAARRDAIRCLNGGQQHIHVFLLSISLLSSTAAPRFYSEALPIILLSLAAPHRAALKKCCWVLRWSCNNGAKSPISPCCQSPTVTRIRRGRYFLWGWTISRRSTNCCPIGIRLHTRRGHINELNNKTPWSNQLGPFLLIWKSLGSTFHTVLGVNVVDQRWLHLHHEL